MNRRLKQLKEKPWRASIVDTRLMIDGIERMQNLLEEILPLAMGASCTYNGRPEADRTQHCCDWSGVVEDICDVLGLEAPGPMPDEKHHGGIVLQQIAESCDGWECSGCGETWSLWDGTPSENHINYCSGCGRRVVGEEPWVQ